MAREIERLYPGCPRERAEAIALAVAASVRHEDTRYDELLMAGADRAGARNEVRLEVERMLERWRRTNP